MPIKAIATTSRWRRCWDRGRRRHRQDYSGVRERNRPQVYSAQAAVQVSPLPQMCLVASTIILLPAQLQIFSLQATRPALSLHPTFLGAQICLVSQCQALPTPSLHCSARFLISHQLCLGNQAARQLQQGLRAKRPQIFLASRLQTLGDPLSTRARQE